MAAQAPGAAEAAPSPPAGAAERATWIASGLEILEASGEREFDVIIVGSGYGGAVAADRLARWRSPEGKPLRIIVLERGLEYLAGSFPSTFAELPGHVRFATGGGSGPGGQLEGLFDLRLGEDLSVLLANGVGGGSLINAGVMELPLASVFAEAAWPPSLPPATMAARAQAMRIDLGAAHPGGGVNGVNGVGGAGFEHGTHRRARMRELGGAATREAPITVALRDGERSCANVRLEKCIGCGDCATGCNHGAKISLDVSLLHRAAERGVRIYSGATVTAVRGTGGAWEIEAWHTDLGRRRRMAKALVLHAPRVILAAGTLGSTEILLRSQGDALRFSPQLGRRFSGNGDIIAAIVGAARCMNASAGEQEAFAERGVGPTITSMIDWRPSGADSGVVVQDLAVPAPLRRLFEEVIATTDTLASLAEPDRTAHDPDDPAQDPCAIDPRRIAHSTVLAIMARDAADGVLSLAPCERHEGLHRDSGLVLDAGVCIQWPAARDDPRVAQAHVRLQREVQRQLGGTLRANPLWQPLPARLAQALEAGNGPLVTVHPLGGCAMGQRRSQGVVNDRGEVFDAGCADEQAVHDGLVVLDGSIIPISLGINPSLTIATVADLAIERLRAHWKLRPPEDGIETPGPGTLPLVRPRFKEVPQPAQRRTRIELIERMAGRVDIGGRQRWVEVSIAFGHDASFDVAGRGATLAGQRLQVMRDGPGAAERLSVLRIYDKAPLDGLPRGGSANPAQPLLEVPVLGGQQRFFHREASLPIVRRWNAVRAFVLNRGLRDALQRIGASLSRAADPGTTLLGRARTRLGAARTLIGIVWDLGSRAGQVRLLAYDIELGAPLRAPAEEFAHWARTPGTPRRLMGRKRITYSRRANLWQQFMRLTLTELGGMTLGRHRVIEVRPNHFEQLGVPLVRIVGQQNQPQALADIGSLALYAARVLLSTHAFSLREPDAPAVRTPRRLPGPLPLLPAPDVHELAPEPGARGLIRLTRYARRGSTRPPVLMIHGYSASGTTFAHPSIKPDCLASFFHGRRVDAWVVDLRSSSGMATATEPWTFEQLARFDVTAAVNFVCEATGSPRIDVVTHCMGSAMLAMALLGEGGPSLRPKVRRWVMSQIGPAMVMSPANRLRAYLLRYLLGAMPRLSYGIGNDAGLPGVTGAALDRALATLPYLDDGGTSEYDIENPIVGLRPWVRTRHRLDALVGRVFDARNMSEQVLAHIDDFFGEVNLQTLSQTIHFAAERFVTDTWGRNWPYERNVQQRLGRLPMLSLHAAANGLADPQTCELMCERLALPAGTLRQIRQDGRGHQDGLIGKDPLPVFKDIDAFLAAPDRGNEAVAPGPAQPSWHGPRLLEALWPAQVAPPSGSDWPRVQARAARSSACYAILLPVKCSEDDRPVVVDALGRPDGCRFRAWHRAELEESAAGVRFFEDELANLGFSPQACDAVAVLFIGPAPHVGGAAGVARAAGCAIPDEQRHLRRAIAAAIGPGIPSHGLARWHA